MNKSNSDNKLQSESLSSSPSSSSSNADSSIKYEPSKYIPDPNRAPIDELLFQQSQPLEEGEKYSNPSDLCCISLLCAGHHRLALIDIETKGFFLPYATCILENVSIDSTLNNLLRKIIDVRTAKFGTLVITSCDRIQIPKQFNYITRYIYRVEITSSTTSNGSNNGQQCVCQQTHKVPIRWLSQTEISQQIDNLWGPEPKFVFEQLNKPNDELLINFEHTRFEHTCRYFSEHCTEDAITGLADNCSVHVNSSKNIDFLKCSNLQPWQITSLYNEFVVQCYPSLWMTFCSFKKFLLKLGLRFTDKKLGKYFRSFDTSKQAFLNFSDLLHGLAVFNAGGTTGAECGHGYCRQCKQQYLWRYYSSAAKHDRLCQDDLCDLLLDLDAKQPTEENIHSMRSHAANILEKCSRSNQPLVESCLEQCITIAKREGVLSEQGGAKNYFKVADLNIQLTNVLLPKLANEQQGLQPAQWIVEENWSDQRCDSCKRVKYYLSSHFIVLSEIGEVGEINRMDKDTKGIPMRSFLSDLLEMDIHVLANDLINRINKFSLFTLHPEDIVGGGGGGGNNNFHTLAENWFFPNKGETIKYLKMIANQAEELFSQEARVLNLSSPCYVFGDIHGNLKDLLAFAQILWKTSPFLNQSRYLFLGDYVDRGQYGVECIIYLFCMKILAPHNFFLLRGNHEIREIQEQFSFYAECCTRFNGELWDIINMAFERLPIAAIIDDKIYCAHGGIPVSVTTIDQIRSIPSPLENPLIQSIEAWEILWNDPISKDEFARLSDFEHNFIMDSRGFARNTKRGTAYLYTETAVQQFFKRNQLQIVIRAHEVFEEGYHFSHRGLVVTVFSSSHYLELNNRAGVLFLDGHKLRVIQVLED